MSNTLPRQFTMGQKNFKELVELVTWYQSAPSCLTQRIDDMIEDVIMSVFYELTNEPLPVNDNGEEVYYVESVSVESNRLFVTMSLNCPDKLSKDIKVEIVPE